MKKPYRSFLLRLWPAGRANDQKWMASLEDPHTRKQIGFSSLESLWSFVDSLIAAELGAPEAGPGIEEDQDTGGWENPQKESTN